CGRCAVRCVQRAGQRVGFPPPCAFAPTRAAHDFGFRHCVYLAEYYRSGALDPKSATVGSSSTGIISSDIFPARSESPEPKPLPRPCRLESARIGTVFWDCRLFSPDFDKACRVFWGDFDKRRREWVGPKKIAFAGWSGDSKRESR